MTKQQALPIFYQLELNCSLEEDNGLIDQSTGAMLVDFDMGWTQMFRSIAQDLATAANCDERNIRQRAALFIQEWGGIEKFGLPALKRLEADLRALSMQITYFRPHAWIGTIALRHVAGELRRAGLLSPREIPSILERLNAQIPPRPLPQLQVRPQEIRRPVEVRDAPWNEQDRLWAEQVGDDVLEWAHREFEFVVAEVSRFKVIEPRQKEYKVHRIRAPGLGANGDNFLDWYRELPAVVWLGQLVPLTEDPAPTLVRRLVNQFGISVPSNPIVICPIWLHRLGWKEQHENSSTYVDSEGIVVASLILWRDAGPVNVEDDSFWGEGTYLVLTASGLRQYKFAQGNLNIHCFAKREVNTPRKGEEGIVLTARRSYSR